ncbi:MAG: hypothetical protein R8K54_05705 [Mariprofundaceae bacterium]
MATYLKIEDSQENPNISIRNDLMGISLLALLLSPWAFICLALYTFNIALLPSEVATTCNVILIAALPKLFQWLKH